MLARSYLRNRKSDDIGQAAAGMASAFCIASALAELTADQEARQSSLHDGRDWHSDCMELFGPSVVKPDGGTGRFRTLLREETQR